MVQGFFLTFPFFKQSSILAVICFRLRHNCPKLTYVDETRLTRKNDYEMKESKSREKTPRQRENAAKMQEKGRNSKEQCYLCG